MSLPQHPANALTFAVVTPIVQEQRIPRISRKPPLRVRRGDGARLAAVAGLAGAAISAKRFLFKEALAFQ